MAASEATGVARAAHHGAERFGQEYEENQGPAPSDPAPRPPPPRGRRGCPSDRREYAAPGSDRARPWSRPPSSPTRARGGRGKRLRAGCPRVADASGNRRHADAIDHGRVHPPRTPGVHTPQPGNDACPDPGPRHEGLRLGVRRGQRRLELITAHHAAAVLPPVSMTTTRTTLKLRRWNCRRPAARLDHRHLPGMRLVDSVPNPCRLPLFPPVGLDRHRQRRHVEAEELRHRPCCPRDRRWRFECVRARRCASCLQPLRRPLARFSKAAASLRHVPQFPGRRPNLRRHGLGTRRLGRRCRFGLPGIRRRRRPTAFLRRWSGDRPVPWRNQGRRAIETASGLIRKRSLVMRFDCLFHGVARGGKSMCGLVALFVPLSSMPVRQRFRHACAQGASPGEKHLIPVGWVHAHLYAHCPPTRLKRAAQTIVKRPGRAGGASRATRHVLRRQPTRASSRFRQVEKTVAAAASSSAGWRPSRTLAAPDTGRTTRSVRRCGGRVPGAGC